MSLSITQEVRPTADVRLLIGELEAELAAAYAADQRHGLPLEQIFQPHIRFFVARRGTEPLGCGGVALFAEFAEVKRMYVRPSARGQGVARAVLDRIERDAMAAGLAELRLETGDQQHAAMRLYERLGFGRCDPFGTYLAMPRSALATSVFFRKPLAATR